MLPSRLLDYQITHDGAIVPRWLGTSDEPWLRELISEATAANSKRVGDAEPRIVDVVAPIARRHNAGRRIVEAVWKVERRRWTTRIDSPVPPIKIRRALFELAAERSREEALATAAAELGLSASELEPLLFADRLCERRLVAPPFETTTSELVHQYNLALVQSFLGRATEVTATVRAHLRKVVGYAKLGRLMATLEEAADGATRITVSGPLALFHDTLKYGNALARWFPSIVATPGWSVEARILLRGEGCRLQLDAGAPLPRTHAMPKAHDSKLEKHLEADLRREAGGRWTVQREAAVVRSRSPETGATRLFFPDFTLVSERGSVVVEVVGFWTPDYLASKLAMLRASNTPMILCVDARHAHGPLAPDAHVLSFTKRIDAPRLVAAAEALLNR